MPRHPPCALDNLTNTPPTTTPHSPKGTSVTEDGVFSTQSSSKHAIHAKTFTQTRKKMLASTIHLTNPSPADHHQTIPDRGHLAMTAQRQTTSPQPLPTRRQQQCRGPGRPLRTQQCTDAPHPTETGKQEIRSSSSTNKPSKQPPTRDEQAALPPSRVRAGHQDDDLSPEHHR